MAVTLVNTQNVGDTIPPAILFQPVGLTTAVVGGTVHLFIVETNISSSGNRITALSVAPGGTLTHEDTIADDATLELELANQVVTATVGGTTYLFGAGILDDGVSAFSVAADGNLINVDNVGDDATLELDGALALAAAVVGGTTYLFASSNVDDGISVFSVAADGSLGNVENVTDDATLQLDGSQGLTTAVVDGTTYLFATGIVDSGVSVFAVAADGSLTNTDNVTDTVDLELAGAVSVASAVVGGKTYLFVGGFGDQGISVFSVAADGTLTNVDNVTNNGTLELGGVSSVKTAVIAGTTYLFAAGQADDGVSVFAVAADGTLVNMGNITDAGALELDGVVAMSTAVVAGSTYLFAAGLEDDGASIFRVDTTGLTINGTAGNDVIDATHAPAGRLLPSSLGDTIKGLSGNDKISGLAGPDVLTGGLGRDQQTGGAGADRFDFNVKSETVRGSNRDQIKDFKRGQDKIDLATIDADTSANPGNDKFKFIGTAAFKGGGGELRCKGGIIQGDMNGDKVADFEIKVNLSTMAKGDFLL